MSRRAKVRAKLADKETRHDYAAAAISAGVSTQVQVMRGQRNWTQRELARRMGTQQPAVSRLEDADSGADFRVGTLLKVAEAFDVAIQVRFVTFSELVDQELSLSHEAIAPARFDEESRADERSVDEREARLKLASELTDSWRESFGRPGVTYAAPSVAIRPDVQEPAQIHYMQRSA